MSWCLDGAQRYAAQFPDAAGMTARRGPVPSTSVAVKHSERVRRGPLQTLEQQRG